MKVLHLITRLDPGGSAENTLLTCQHLAEGGWEAVLASGPGRSGKRAEVGGADVPVTIVPGLRRDPAPIADCVALWRLYRLLRRERPQIVHTHSAKAGVLGRWAARMARVPGVVHTPHGHVLYGYARGIKNWLYLLAERVSAPITDRLVALSEGELRESAAAGIGSLEQWTVIPSGVPLNGEPPGRRRASDGRVRIGVVARLEPVKGIDVLVRAAARLLEAGATGAAPPVDVLVWGDGQERDALLELADACGARDTVQFVGTTEPVTSFLAGLDVYVQPSRNEGMGRALVLAQWAGLPVVASRVCGIPDVVRDGETGILVPPDEPEQLAEALVALLADPARRDELGSAAHAWVLSRDETGFPRFSVDAMNWRLRRLYEELVGDRR